MYCLALSSWGQGGLVAVRAAHGRELRLQTNPSWAEKMTRRVNLDKIATNRTSMQRRPAILCALFSLLFICHQTSARTADPDLRKALAERAAFGADQLAALERGEPGAKLIPSNDPREVAVCGVIEIPSDPETALKAFQLSLSLK